MERTASITPRMIIAAMADRCRRIPDVCRIEYPIPNAVTESPTAIWRLGRYTRVNPDGASNAEGQRWEMEVICRLCVLAKGDTPSEMGRVDALIPWFVDAFDNSLVGAVSQLFPDLPYAGGEIEEIAGPMITGDINAIVSGEPAYATDLTYTVRFTRDGETLP